MKAGHEVWPRVCENLRASCANDWVERYPAHVVAGWRGQDSKEPGFTREKPGVEQSTNVKSNAVPPDLAEVVAAWGRLPAAVRAGIVAMVRASIG